MPQPDLRSYEVDAQSTDTFGRVACRTRHHRFVVDGPVQNGCPGEEVTPAELFLMGVAACGVELLHVIARAESLPLARAHVNATGLIDRSRPVRADLTVFNSVTLRFALTGVSEAQGAALIAGFKRR
jgi:uncharacterized OsmC-like protein